MTAPVKYRVIAAKALQLGFYPCVIEAETSILAAAFRDRNISIRELRKESLLSME